MSRTFRCNRATARAAFIGLGSVGALASCGGGHHLAEYPFTSRTLAVVYIAPPAPELLTSYYDLEVVQYQITRDQFSPDDSFFMIHPDE